MGTFKGVFGNFGLAFSVTLSYVIIFIVICLVMDKSINKDLLALPAIILYLLITGILFITKTKEPPRMFVLGGFFISWLLAIVMAMWGGQF